ncbi:MAG: hydrogenase maturation protease [Rhodobacteraceae bacterium]|nr:hydrogenase maturation protease [Paracoccaceae bacterium]
MTGAPPPAGTLVIGYGNPGRGDDGLGPALAGGIAALGLPGVAVEIDYQLTVEHAALLVPFGRVLFADAMTGLEVPFRLMPVAADDGAGLDSHRLTPGAVLALAGLLFGRRPEAWILAIAGTAFDRLDEGLSPAARRNLAAALDFAVPWLAGATAPPDAGPRRPEQGVFSENSHQNSLFPER